MCRSRHWFPTIPDRPTRRGLLLAAFAGLPLLSRTGRAASSGLPDGADLLIAGPSGGRLDRVSMDLLPALEHGLPAGTPLRRELAGGPDGVTGANQFEARAAPDGANVLLMPGDAALAWLIGDPRAHFTLGNLVPVMAGVTQGVLMSRYRLEQLGPGGHLRIVAGRPDGPELAALLALDLLGLRADPTFGSTDPAAVEQVILAKGADAAFVAGADAERRIARLTRAGLQASFVLGVPGADQAVLRDPRVPGVPTLPELAIALNGTAPSGLLYDAWRAVSAAAQLSFLLALPGLTPAALVSLWRQAGLQAAGIIPLAEPAGVRMIAGPEATEFTAPIAAADTASLIALRQWLTAKLGWQPA